MARAILCLQNLERRKRRLRPLELSPALNRIASLHAADMTGRRFFSHDSPTRGGLAVRVRRARYRGRAAENIGAGRATPKLLAQMFLKSPAHRANLLGPRWRYGGVASVPTSPLGRQRPGGTFAALFGTTRK